MKLVSIENNRPITDSLTVEALKSLLASLVRTEKALKNSYENFAHMDENLTALDKADIDKLIAGQFPFITAAIRERVMRNFSESRMSERDVHDWFKQTVTELIGDDYSIVTLKNDPKHIPDFWLGHQGEYIPVEIKLHSFTEANLRQLKRYMDFYGCEKGIAVGKDLKCEIPDNIRFVSHSSNKGA